MSSTEFTIGLEGGRNSSKVLKPPGGGTSDIFGLGSSGSAAVKEPVKASSTQSRLFGYGEVTPPTKYVKRNPITGEGFSGADKVVDEVIDVQASDDEVKITKDSSVSEKACEQPVTAAPKVVQTSIRVRNPPGGKSSGIF